MAKRIAYKVTDEAAFREAYPQLFTDKQVTVTTIDKEAAYQVVKLHHRLEKPLPGVEIVTPPPASETSKPSPDLGPTHNQLA